ncbi:class I SAM-dependent methyltransferase [Luteimonas yindakuii]|uniref:Class I SAM-dependent methyltransferase n=1 Tax=Luteimonas yindakuii TaxID=2565782 RepID=A0A4Z1R3C9_9GAMM|nr:class I SAM-dependent methyltransferase [Luteimonas yindakuii]QCO67725.1 class I SAM-dependent methyltransferase [Luteimonas yindakuii]TKS54022.1 class I SAM-dependent methyltransferase [Luteimonas yindakuii]
MSFPKTFAGLLLCLPLLSACADEAAPSERAASQGTAATTSDAVDMQAVSAATEPPSPYAEVDIPKPSREPDVIYVPTPQPVVDAMLELAGVNSNDVLYDLGSGDGRIPVTAAQKHGIRAVGIDINPVRIREAKANAEKAGVTDLVSFREEDLFEADISEATVVTLYLLQSLNVRLRPKLLSELKPGTRIVSHAFDMANEWEPEETRAVGDSSMIYLWTVPER